MMKFLLRLVLTSCGVFLSLAAPGYGSEQLPSSADQIRPLLIGQQVPSVTIKSISDEKINLRDLMKRKPSVIVFYRGGWCPYCNLHFKEIREVEKKLKGIGYQILAISPDKTEELKKSVTKNSIGYELFSDSSNEASRAFGLAFKVDSSTLEKYRGFGIDLEKAAGNADHILPVPAVFVVDTSGEIQFEYINPNYKVRISGELLLTAAKVAQDKNKKKGNK